MISKYYSDQIYQKREISLNMFGRKKKQNKPELSQWNMYEKAEKKLIAEWFIKSSSSEKLSRLYKERSVIQSDELMNKEQRRRASRNTDDSRKSENINLGDQPVNMFGVVYDTLNDSYKGRAGYQVAAAEEGRLDGEWSKIMSARFENAREILKEIEIIERKILCQGCLELQPFRAPTTEDFEFWKSESDRFELVMKHEEFEDPIPQSEQYQNLEIFATVNVVCCACDGKSYESVKSIEPTHQKALTQRDGIKEPARQNNDNSFCDNCGKSLRPAAKFCGGCGTPVS